eukprot:Pgem_evm1s9268
MAEKKGWAQLNGIRIRAYSCPTVTVNLAGVKKLFKYGYTVQLEETRAIVEGNGVREIFQCVKNLWVLQLKAGAINTAVSSSSLQTWHNRLGHTNVRAIVNMVNNNVVDVCESCQLGKGRRANFATENLLKASANFEHIVFDTKGKMDIPAIGGYYWAISFTCTFSEYNQWYLLKNKSDAKTVVMLFINTVVLPLKPSNVHPTLHCDNAGEFLSNSLVAQIHSKGIRTTYTPPYYTLPNAMP